MNFVTGLVEEFTHKGHRTQPQQQQYQQPYQQSGGNYSNAGGPPQVPRPWVARWDEPARRWIYINEATGERTFEYPGRGEYYQSGPPPQQYYDGGREQYGAGERYYEQPARSSGGGRHSGLMYGAVGAAAGLAGGALLDHEAHKVENDWDRDKYRVENDVENFPDDAARWTGRGVGDVEDIPQDVEYDYDRAKYGVENRFDDAVQDVEDVPDDAARWAGDRVGDIERFDDGIENSYDQGRDDTRWGY
ncbi:hypothetical protein NEOLEDRAFT_1136398 [Neolentinus lepideus HHB14362 ss-1]|uniref:WW domain-containing protein n=1 Tax=Neolentinus lepideus HHB14362 ss-1 TaxID=1314782 RepID=A0A165RBY8_9AGAM|nr:hypothetical protein NEOLEDRAFT_1136398 [Neolentinus lepideus HHB14362 ss-1]